MQIQPNSLHKQRHHLRMYVMTRDKNQILTYLCSNNPHFLQSHHAHTSSCLRICILLAASTEWKTFKPWTDLIGFSNNPFEGDHSTFPELNLHFPQVKTFVLSLTNCTTEKDKYNFFQQPQSNNHTHGHNLALKDNKDSQIGRSRVASEYETVGDVMVCNSI